MSVFYWEYRFDLVPVGLLVLGLLLAHRTRWGWSGAALGIGALVKWIPAVSFVFLVVWLIAGRRWRDVRWFATSFLVVLLIHVPLLLWNAKNVLNPYSAQGSRETTNESVWYFPLKALGFTGEGSGREWAPTGAPHEADMVVGLIQAALLLSLLAAVVLVRRSPARGLAIAALAPALFLLTNRVFSPQFVLVVAPAIVVACALTARDRNEQLIVGALVMGAAFANAFVYPYAGALIHDVSWTAASAVVYLLAFPAFVVVLRRTMTDRALAVEVVTPRDDPVPDFGFVDTAAVIAAQDVEGVGDTPQVPSWSGRVRRSSRSVTCRMRWAP
jgi:uncharacterized membrane protein